MEANLLYVEHIRIASGKHAASRFSFTCMAIKYKLRGSESAYIKDNLFPDVKYFLKAEWSQLMM
jgi:hypothetical protein